MDHYSFTGVRINVSKNVCVKESTYTVYCKSKLIHKYWSHAMSKRSTSIRKFHTFSTTQYIVLLIVMRLREYEQHSITRKGLHRILIIYRDISVTTENRPVASESSVMITGAVCGSHAVL